jgi:hypothetical protein
VKGLATKIIELTGSSSKLRFLPMRPGEPDRRDSFRPPDLTVANALIPGARLGALASLDVGMSETIEWYRNGYARHTETS